jgi:membrane protease YdiL (CAAX protease family)
MTLQYASIPTANPPDPRGRRYNRVGAAVSWLVIVGSLLAVGIVNFRASRTPARAEAVGDFQLLVSSRVAVGEVRQLNQWKICPKGLPEQAIAQLKLTAIEPAQKLRVIPVIGEISGAAAASAQLEEWAADLKAPNLNADAKILRSIYAGGPSPPTSDDRQQLIAREGWYGKLAASYGATDADPVRREVLRKSQKAFLGTAVFGITVATALVVGFVLLVLTIIFLSLGKIHRCYRPAPWRSSVFLEAFALYLGGYVIISLLVRWLLPHSIFVGTTIALAWVPVVMLWPLVRGITWPELKGAFGWYTGRGPLREMGAGIVVYVAGLPIIATAAIITSVVSKRFGATTAHPIMFSDTNGVLNVVELYLFAAVWAPLVEETMFRGALFNHLRQWHGWLLSAVVSSFIFAALHPQGWAAIPVLGSIGFVLAAAREWRGTFIANATAHAMNNAFVTTLLIFVLR